MYHGKVKTLVTGFVRGKNDADYDESQFNNDAAWIAQGRTDVDSARDSVCQIPLSQPYFLGAVLLLWTFTALVQCVNTVQLMLSVCMLQSKPISEAIERPDEE